MIAVGPVYVQLVMSVYLILNLFFLRFFFSNPPSKDFIIVPFSQVQSSLSLLFSIGSVPENYIACCQPASTQVALRGI